MSLVFTCPICNHTPCWCYKYPKEAEKLSGQKDIGTALSSPHYNQQVIQPIELMQSLLTPEEFIGYLKGNVLKYKFRMGTKQNESEEKDLNKHKQYHTWLLQAQAGKTINPRD